MSHYQDTDEQVAIIDAAKTGEDVVICAGAGTGKTSTLVRIADELPGRGLYLAYNKTIAADGKYRFSRQVQCRTAHSIAYQKMVAGTDFERRLRASRMPPREQARVLRVNGPVRLTSHGLPTPPWKLMRLVNATVRNFCNSADRGVQPHHVPRVPLMDGAGVYAQVQNIIAPLARDAWKDISDERGALPYDHDHYLKLWSLTDPQALVDYILFDECQDANPCIVHIVQNQQRAQKIAVGDSSQAIYGWRGAIDALTNWPAKHRLNLSRSWRFGAPIAAEANRWLALLNADLRLTGNPSRESTVEDCALPDAVLCRTNAGALAAVIKAVANERKATIVGGGEDIRRIATAAVEMNERGSTTHPELYMFSSWAEVGDYVEQSDDAALRLAVNLINEHTPQRLIDIIDSMCPEPVADVVMSTSHKAKGREWGRVQIGDDFGSLTDKDGKLRRSELMLAYVAITRAKFVLDRGSLSCIDELDGLGD